MLRQRPQRNNSWYVAIFFVLVALPFLGVFPYINVVMNPNENTRTYLTIAAVEHHTFQLDPVVQRFGWVNDMASVRDKRGIPHSYSVKGPINSFVAMPVYWLQCKWARWRHHPPPQVTDSAEKRNEWFETTTWVLRMFTVQLPCFLFLIWFERYLRGFTRDRALRLLAVAAAGLGTNYLGYAHMFASHALFAVAAFVGFGMAERELRTQPDPRKRSLGAAFWSGMGIAAATGLEYHGFFLSAVLALFGLVVFYRPTRMVSYGLGAAIPMGIVAFYQWKAFGSPLTPGHKFVENPLWAAEHARGLYGVILPKWEAVGGLSFHPGYGFFGMSPYMLFGLAAIFTLMIAPRGADARARSVQRWSTAVWAMGMFALWFAMCGAIEWRAGWVLGPRRAGAAPPFFALGSLLFLERISTRWPTLRNSVRGIAAGFALAGILAIGLVGIVYNTLPEDIARPLTQFALPLIRVGVVPHHNAELLGFKGTEFWYLCAAALLAAPLFALFAGMDPEPTPEPVPEPEPSATPELTSESKITDESQDLSEVDPLAPYDDLNEPALEPAPAPQRSFSAQIHRETLRQSPPPNASVASVAKVAPRASLGSLWVIPALCIAGFPAAYVPKATPAVSLSYWATYWQPPSRDRIASLVKRVNQSPCTWHWIADAQVILHYDALAAENRTHALRPQAQCQRGVFRWIFP
ncbi:MAG: hypothetical protein Q8Q09_24850 [Deltaproteobacteria bacterium]|nr:hypothetical protein [Deltaproteobacteria bacterium]